MQRGDSRRTRAGCAARRAGRAATRTAAVLVPLAAAALGLQAQAEPPPDRQWKLVFSDDFEGRTIDPAKWKLSQLGGWALNGIRTELTPTNSFLDGQGHFVNVLSRDAEGVLRYHWGIDTKGRFAFTYGYAEARVQFSREPGWWSAFWLWGVDKGVNPFLKGQEIDIYEDFFKPKRRRDIQHAVHFDTELKKSTAESDRNVGEARMIDATRMERVSKGCLQGAELADYGGWHTVAVEWTPLEYVWYVDGKETARLDYTQVPVTTQPQFILLSGIFRAPRETDDPRKLFYGDIREAKLPDRFMVDYVRVYQEDPAARPRPVVRLDRKAGGTELAPGDCAEIEASAVAPGDRIERLCLFSNGRLRAETTNAQHVFRLPSERLFEGTNALVAIARTARGAIGLSEPLLASRNAAPAEKPGTAAADAGKNDSPRPDSEAASVDTQEPSARKRNPK
jgi:beta-glucanase (GH16 family)